MINVKSSLKNKVVFISGASSGFGSDAARLFAREGCKVVLAARRTDRLVELADQIKAEGGEALAVNLDVTYLSSINEAVQQTLENYGSIDVLLNNAGMGRLEWLEQLDPQVDIQTQLAINLGGVIQLTRAILPTMLSRREGTIINMISVAGLISAPSYTIYAATKFGVRGFTDALRREAGVFGIRVAAIYPGPAKTEFGQHTGASAIKKNLKTPDWLYMSSEYVARRIVGLARHPRRKLVIPWYYSLAIGFDGIFPSLVDWFLNVVFVKRAHKLEE
jgi:short-subunit dehydrogenase